MKVIGLLSKITLISILIVIRCLELGGSALAQDPTKDSGDKFFAILAGVTHYEGDALKFTKENSIDRAVPELKEAFKFFAMKKGYLEHNIHICVLTDVPYQEENEQSLCWLGESKTIAPTKENIENIFNVLLTEHSFKLEEGKKKRRNNSSQDTFIFYFTGHGIFHGGDIQLFTSGSRGGLENDLTNLDGEVIDHGKFVMTLADWESKFSKNLRSQNQFIIIDACQNQGDAPGRFGISRKLLSQRLAGVFNGNLNQVNPLVLALSSSTGEYSYIDEKFHMGFFTKHLIKMIYGAADLSGDLEINSEEMDGYFKGVSDDVKARIGKLQHAHIHPYRLDRYVLYRRPYAPQTHFFLLDHNKLVLTDRLDDALSTHINELRFEIFSRDLETELLDNHKGRVTPFKEDRSRDEKFYKELNKVIPETQTCYDMTDQTKNKIHSLAQKYYPTQFPDSLHIIVGWLNRLAQQNTNEKNELGACFWFFGNNDMEIGYHSKVQISDIFAGSTPEDFTKFYLNLSEKILETLDSKDPVFMKKMVKAQSIDVNPNGRIGFLQNRPQACAKFLIELNHNFQRTDLVYWGITLDPTKEGILQALSCTAQHKSKDGRSAIRSLLSGKQDVVGKSRTVEKSASGRPDSPSPVVGHDFILSGRISYMPKEDKVSVCGQIRKPNPVGNLLERQISTRPNINTTLLAAFEVSLGVFLGENGDKNKGDDHENDEKVLNFETDVLEILSLKLANRLSYGDDAKWYLASDSNPEILEKCLPILD